MKSCGFPGRYRFVIIVEEIDVLVLHLLFRGFTGFEIQLHLPCLTLTHPALYMLPLCIPGAANPVASFSSEDREEGFLCENDEGNNYHGKRCHNGKDRIKTCFVERIRKDTGYYTSAGPVSSADREILRNSCTAFVAGHCHEVEEHTHRNEQHNKADHLSDDHAVSFVRYVKCCSSEQSRWKDVSHKSEHSEQDRAGISPESAAPAENAHEQYD